MDFLEPRRLRRLARNRGDDLRPELCGAELGCSIQNRRHSVDVSLDGANSSRERVRSRFQQNQPADQVRSSARCRHRNRAAEGVSTTSHPRGGEDRVLPPALGELHRRLRSVARHGRKHGVRQTHLLWPRLGRAASGRTVHEDELDVAHGSSLAWTVPSSGNQRDRCW